MKGTGVEAIFPLWGMPTRALAGEMLAGGLRACLTCVDPCVLPAEFPGRELSHDMQDGLPLGVDPCGENGEFHTSVFAGPIFTHSLDIEIGETVACDGFVFADCWLRELTVEGKRCLVPGV